MARSSYCPVVLTENGFISNTYDYSNMISDAALTKKAVAISKGIADYFLASSPDDVPLTEEPENPPVQEPEIPPAIEPEEPEESSKPSEPSDSNPETPSVPPENESSNEQTSSNT